MSEPTPPEMSPEPASKALDLSIVFATRDRATQLRQTLAAYEVLDTHDLSWEIVVIDNDSRDDTATVLQAASTYLPLVTLHVAAGGQNRARNAALGCLRGDLVIFTDDDVIPDAQCLNAYTAAAARWPHDVIFGARIDPAFPAGTPDWMRSDAFDFGTTAFARYAPRSDEGPVKTHPYGPSFALRRCALPGHYFPENLGPQSGGYAMGGEAAFLSQIAAAGHRYIHVPTARVQHVVRPEQIGKDWLLQRAQNKGRGQVYLPSRRQSSYLSYRGVSLKLRLSLARAFARYYAADLFLSHRRCIERGITYQLRLGRVLELQRLHSQKHKKEVAHD